MALVGCQRLPLRQPAHRVVAQGKAAIRRRRWQPSQDASGVPLPCSPSTLSTGLTAPLTPVLYNKSSREPILHHSKIGARHLREQVEPLCSGSQFHFPCCPIYSHHVVATGRRW
jgi:hypothetical protein